MAKKSKKRWVHRKNGLWGRGVAKTTLLGGVIFTVVFFQWTDGGFLIKEEEEEEEEEEEKEGKRCRENFLFCFVTELCM